MAYASKYYDPAKAHEYYEKHKKLKGRTSTAGLNDSGRNAAKMVREALMAEKKEYNQKVNEALKAKVEEIKKELKEKIANMREELKNKLKGLSKEEKAKIKEQYKGLISGMREEYKGKTQTVKDAAKQAKEQAKEQYQQMYENEIAKIKGDKSMQKVKKSKGKSKK